MNYNTDINWSLREVSVMRRVLIFWSVAALILTNFYTCLLISFLSSPNTYPMVSSITEVASRQDIQVVVDKGTNTEAILLVKTHLTIFVCDSN